MERIRTVSGVSRPPGFVFGRFASSVLHTRRGAAILADVTSFLCETCGVQHAERADAPDRPPERCPICLDERQYVGFRGQRWTTLDELRANRRNQLDEPESGALAIDT